MTDGELRQAIHHLEAAADHLRLADHYGSQMFHIRRMVRENILVLEQARADKDESARFIPLQAIVNK